MAKKSWQKSRINDDVCHLLVTTVKEKLFKSNHLSRFQKDANQGKNKIPLAFTCQASENKDVPFCPFLHHNTKCRILWKLIGQIS